MSEYRTADGRRLTESDIERLADEAEAGFPGKTLAKPRKGRPWLDDSGPSRSRTVRLPGNLDIALTVCAESENVSPSEIIREALSEYLSARESTFY